MNGGPSKGGYRTPQPSDNDAECKDLKSYASALRRNLTTFCQQYNPFKERGLGVNNLEKSILMERPNGIVGWLFSVFVFVVFVGE